jgi:S1-C subfamily serine protease
MQEQTVLIRASDGQGSGVVVERHNSKGTRVFVWTANHVVEKDSEVEIHKAIRTEGHRVGEAIFKAKVIGRDVARDVAVLWVDAPAGYFRAAEFASDEPLKVGTPLTHVGNAHGNAFEDSVSTGILSQIGLHPDGWPWVLTDQGAFAATFGCSGGPVFRQSDREVVGLLVGGVVGSGYINFVPVRIISEFANGNGYSWAVRGSTCPNDPFLNALAFRDSLLTAKPDPAKTFSVN